MHEGVLTEDLFEHILIHAKEANARHVRRVKVTIGALSDATPNSIRFYFDSLAPGTLVEGAALEFESAPGAARCSTCDKEFEIVDIYSACPQCGAFPLKVTRGNGVYLSSLDIETEEADHEQIHE